MRKQKKLFSEKTFDYLEKEKYVSLANELNQLSDGVLLSKKNDLEAFVGIYVERFGVKPVGLNFDNKVATVVGVPVTATTERKFVHYSIPISGTRSLLWVWPYSEHNYTPEDVSGEVIDANLVIPIDALYHGEPIPQRNKEAVVNTYNKITDYLNRVIIDLNARAVAFNTKIAIEIKNDLESRIAKAEIRAKDNDYFNGR